MNRRELFEIIFEDVYTFGLQKMKQRTLLRTFKYEKRSEQNTKKLTNELFQENIIITPSILRNKEGEWTKNLDEMIILRLLRNQDLYTPDAEDYIDWLRYDGVPDTEAVEALYLRIQMMPNSIDLWVVLVIMLQMQKRYDLMYSMALEMNDRLEFSSTKVLCAGIASVLVGQPAYDSISCFRTVEKNARTIFEYALAMAWIRKTTQDDAYKKDMTKNLDKLESSRLSWIPDETTPLIDVFYPLNVEIRKGEL